MRALYLFLFLSLVSLSSQAQIFSCPTCAGSAPTIYTNGQPNDSVFFVCGTNTADLVATSPTSLVGIYNYTWQYFNPFTNTWDLFFSAPLVLSPQTLTGVGPGGYRVVITDAFDTFMGVDVAWVSEVDAPTSVDVAPIPAGCGGTINLTGLVNMGSATPYYNSPADLSSPVIIGPSTSINLCLNGTHTFNSDMVFNLIGPASCGSPNVLLSPYSSAMGQAVNCNPQANFSNLCFTNQSTASFNICAAGGNMTGNFGAYGLGAGTPINWSAFNGCDATSGPWTLRIRDCYSTLAGTLFATSSLTITGANSIGVPTTVTYVPASNTPIADGTCAQPIGGSFNSACCTPTNVPLNLPISSPTPLPMNLNYTWTANPTGPIITVASGAVPASGIITATVPAPSQDTQFTLTISGMLANASCAGNSSDTESYDNLGSTAITIQSPSVLCVNAATVALVPSIPGGTWSGTGVNAATGIFNPTAAGVGFWTVNYFTGGACPSTGSTTIQVTAPQTSIITAPSTLCSDAAAVTLTANNTGGTWSGAGVDASGLFTPTAVVGSQTITYTPAAGQCFATGTANIEVIQTPTVTITDVAPVCSNTPAFGLTSSFPGVTWSGSGVDPVSGVFTPTTAGSYVITATASGACAASDNTTVNVQALAVPVLGAPAQICVLANSESLTADITGGIWTGTGVTAAGVFDPMIAGVGTWVIDYSINGVCPSSASVSIEVQAAQPSVITAPSTLCSNAVQEQLTANNPGGIWSGTGVDASGLFTPSGAVGLQTITYTPASGQCFASGTAIIEVIQTPTLSIADVAPVCSNSSSFVLVSSLAGVTWSGSGVDPTTGLFTPTSAGSYEITATASGTCAASDNTFVDVVDPVSPVITAPVPTVIGAPVEICVSEISVLFTADLLGGSWSGPGVSSSGDFNASAAGVGGPYTITYTLNDVCLSSSTALISVIDQPIVTITDLPNTLCANSSPVALTASLPGGVWSGVGVNTVTGVFSPSAATNGPNTIIYTISGVCSATDNTLINVVAAPIVNITQATPFCLNSLNTTLVANQIGGTWSGAGILDPVTGSFSPSTAGVGTSQITYTYTSSPCTVSATSNVVVNPLPTVFAGNDAIICSGASTALLATGASTYQWSINGSTAVGLNNPNIPNPSASPTTTTTYSVLGVDANGCTNVDQIEVSVYTQPNVSAGSNVFICPGSSITLSASGASTYTWSPSSSLTGANTSSPVANPATTQTYTVTGTDASGCQNNAQVTVTVYPQPTVTASSNSPIVECQTAQLTANGLVSYNWVNTAGPDASISTPSSSSTDVGPSANATYTVAGLDVNGCAGSATISVVVNPITVSIVNATSLTSSTYSFDLTSNASNFDWDFYSDGITDVSTSATTVENTYGAAPTPPLNYVVTTVTASIGNCEAQDTIHIFIDNTILVWPNIVVIDNDPRNNLLSFLSQDASLQPNWESITSVPTITNFKAEIFNRWGKKVGEVNDPTGAWDPNEFGAGVYFYFVTYTKRSTGLSAEEIEVEQTVEVFVK